MNAVPKNPLVNFARDFMTRIGDQKKVLNDEPAFVRQLDLIEIKDDDVILEAIKRKFQADANRQRWIRDDDKKTNNKRQIKISKKKHLVAKDLKVAWHDGVA